MPLVCCATRNLLLLLLLLAAIFPAGHGAEQQQAECAVQEDGSCLGTTAGTSSTEQQQQQQEPKKAVVDIPALPPVGEDGLLDAGFGERQQILRSHEPQIMERLRRMQEYMYGEVLVDGGGGVVPRDVASECLLRNAQCAYWAAIGECEANPPYMTLQCAPVCRTCQQLSFETRCPLTDLPPDIWQPGDLNRMFERIVTDEYYVRQGYRPRAILKPGTPVPGGQDAPWVVTVDDFLTAEECDALIRLGGERGYERSKDVGQKKFDGTYDSHLSEGRTSSNAWCLDACYEHEVTQRVLDKIANLTGIPDSHHEYLQMLQYHENQFYEQHHDYIEFHLKRAQGVRIITVFLYLNDVEEGGGTRFPKLNVTVLPKRGRALIWPSVKNEEPSAKDFRTDHEAMPVIKGIKYGANAWVHMRDFKEPYSKNCI